MSEPVDQRDLHGSEGGHRPASPHRCKPLAACGSGGSKCDLDHFVRDSHEVDDFDAEE